MRIWITGVGTVSGLGIGSAVTMERLLAGDQAMAPATLFDVSALKCKIAAEARDLSVPDVAPAGEAERWSRTDAMALLASREALARSGVDPRSETVDLVIGGSTGGMFETESLIGRMYDQPELQVPTPSMAAHPLAATAFRLRETLGPFRRVRTLCSACSSGTNAVIIAANWLRAGRSKRVLVGGSDSLCQHTFAGFDALKLLDKQPCRPFDEARAGLNLGEGAAFLVLEIDEEARRRGVAPIAEVVGDAVGTEAHHMTQPEADAQTVTRLIGRALQRARLEPGSVDYVNAHGTGTLQNDRMETTALRNALGRAEEVWVSSCKGQLGHTLGAAGALGTAITALAIEGGAVPPTGGLQNPDPACAARHVMGRGGRRLQVDVALTNSFGFGGLDSVLVLTRPELAEPFAERSATSIVISSAATMGPLGLRDAQGTGAYLDATEPPPQSTLEFDPDEYLDHDRYRRFARWSQVMSLLFQELLDKQGFDPPLSASAEDGCVGGIVGNAFGSVDLFSAYFSKSARFKGRCPNPLLFTNLVLSAPAANAALYLGLRGPVFVTCDLGTSTESALHSAVELLSVDEADAICAGGFAELSPIVEKVFDPVLLRSEEWQDPRTEGAVGFLLEKETAARARGATPLARVVYFEQGQGDCGFEELPAPASSSAKVFLAREPEGGRCDLAGTGWEEAPTLDVSRRVGNHEATGGMAVALAVAALASGSIDEALVLGDGPDCWSVFVLGAADSREES